MKKSEVKNQLRGILERQEKGIEICNDERANILFKAVLSRLIRFTDMVFEEQEVKQKSSNKHHTNKATEDFLNSFPFGKMFK